ncbi:MAG: V-type ATP synthase subunit D [Spirochaetes bacterium]|uniref:V-type ATP synthase subunit D n=1 Tax=Candidatus Ornithospirochaeta stercoripullorum TaxID=2840899 RepID=A0A9D9H5G3_9SPIO|nr:V-type ATP synthase subunit D [Candidatus Ornithospirochaeta stercoripullorum]
MAVKLTKNEQKKQKDALRQYQRYLPTLQLKQQQLQTVIRESQREIEKLKEEQRKAVDALSGWIAVYGGNASFPPDASISTLVQIDRIEKDRGNIAGVEVPVFKELLFKRVEYDLSYYPLWVDKALDGLKSIAEYDALIATLEERIELLSAELRTTTQRVNLFEKVKIPETKENIRMIGIYLQDQQTSAVVRGKIAKKKLVKVG